MKVNRQICNSYQHLSALQLRGFLVYALELDKLKNHRRLPFPFPFAQNVVGINIIYTVWLKHAACDHRLPKTHDWPDMIEVSLSSSDDESDGDSMEQPELMLAEGSQQEHIMSTDADTSDDDIKEDPELMIWQGNHRKDLTIVPSDPNEEDIIALAHTLQLCGTGGTGDLD